MKTLSMRAICLFLSTISLSACAHAHASMPPTEEESPPNAAVVAAEETAQREFVAMRFAGRHNFDRGATAAALGQAARDVSVCLKPNEPQGSGHTRITFAPNGQVASVDIDQPPFQDAPSHVCIQTIFFRATVPPFEGAAVQVGKSFTLGVDEVAVKSNSDEKAANKAVSAIDFSGCNPHNYEKPGLYRAGISFARDGSVSNVEPRSIPPGEDAECIIEKIRAKVRMPAREGRTRWIDARIYLPLSLNPTAVNP